MESEVYDDTVKIHLMCLQLLAEKNLLRWETVDLGRYIYGSQIPERDTHSIVYLEQCDYARLIVGATSDVSDSLVSINQRSGLNRVSHVPMRSIASSQWSAELKESWPGGWLIPRMDTLEIRVTWNGKEQPGKLNFVYLMMVR